MKKILLFISTLILSLSLFAFSTKNKARAYSNDLDRINSYEVVIDPKKEDGSVNTTISISWTVLDSTSEGPLEWVEIGIPNKYVKNIQSLTSNISKAKYYSDDGSYIRIDFDRSYHAGETVEFSFSFNEYRLYQIKGDYIYYNYATGYFNEIYVDKCILKWNMDGVDTSSYITPNSKEEDGYYVYESALDYGKQLNVEFSYQKSYFDSVDSKLQFSSEYHTLWDYFLPSLIIAGIIVVIAAIYIIDRLRRDPYMDNRGFIGHYYYYPFFYHRPYGMRRYRQNGGVDRSGDRLINPTSSSSSSTSHSSGGGCACACACACAGGGRAGCSKKDFYSAKLKKKALDERLK